MENNPYHVIDDVLVVFNGGVQLYRREVESRLVDQNIIIEMPVIDSILDKLEEEKYLTIQEIKNYHTTGFSIDKKYKISYKGYILVNHEGGYYQKIKKGKADANKKVLYEKIVTIGAGLGGIYVCIQIVGVVLDLFHLEIDILLIKKLLHSLVLFLLFPCNYI